MSLKVYKKIKKIYNLNNIVNFAKFSESQKYLQNNEKEYTTKIYFSRKNDIKNIIENMPTSPHTLTDSLLYFKNNKIKL